MSITQAERARAYRALHERPGMFLMPNPWDAGTAKLFASLGFEALATTSLGLASSLGRVDGTLSVSREELIANCRQIASATDLPLNADLENGYADDPDEAAEIFKLAAEAGVVGGSIEDATGNAAQPIYDFDLAVKRVAAAARVAHSLPFPFTFTARAENYLHGRPDFEDTVRRLRAFAEAGADVLYAPGLRDLATIRRLVAALPRPLNVVMGMIDPEITVPQLAEAGVKRVSIGGALARRAYAAVRDAAISMRDAGSFRWVREAMPGKELNAIFEKYR
jgi:2-methylisocitrate lyase-like PEP mutase family enzyme